MFCGVVFESLIHFENPTLW